MVGNKQHKINLYADDILLFLESSMESIETLKQILEEFKCCTGLKINYDKSKLLCINIPILEEKEIKKRTGLDLCYSSFKYLGIWITKKIRQLVYENYKKYLQLCSKLFNPH